MYITCVKNNLKERERERERECVQQCSRKKKCQEECCLYIMCHNSYKIVEKKLNNESIYTLITGNKLFSTDILYTS